MHLKVETHHLVAGTHSVKAGTFPVQMYQEHPHGLYVERDFYGHPAHKHWQAHILPTLNLQVCRFIPHRGTPQWEYYVDIVQVECQSHLWRVQDLYRERVWVESPRFPATLLSGAWDAEPRPPIGGNAEAASRS